MQQGADRSCCKTEGLQLGRAPGHHHTAAAAASIYHQQRYVQDLLHSGLCQQNPPYGESMETVGSAVSIRFFETAGSVVSMHFVFLPLLEPPRPPGPHTELRMGRHGGVKTTEVFAKTPVDLQRLWSNIETYISEKRN